MVSVVKLPVGGFEWVEDISKFKKDLIKKPQ